MICFVIQNCEANHSICISTQRESPINNKKDCNSYPYVGWIWVSSSNWNYYFKLLEAAILVIWKLRTNHWVWFTCDPSQRLYVLGAIESYLFIHRTVHRGLHYPISPQIPKHDDVTYKCEICMNKHSYTNPQIKLHNNHPQQTHQRSLLQNTPKGAPF